jgi:ABC-type multidrug transport system fused ATPase/permease subunit
VQVSTGGLRVAYGASSVADLAAFLLYMVYLTGPVSSAFQAVGDIQQGTGALQRINEVLALPREPTATPAGSAAPNQESSAASRTSRHQIAQDQAGSLTSSPRGQLA